MTPTPTGLPGPGEVLYQRTSPMPMSGPLEELYPRSPSLRSRLEPYAYRVGRALGNYVPELIGAAIALTLAYLTS